MVMHRRGEFNPAQRTDNQCKVRGHHNYKYHLMFICDPKLDKSGFLIDHQLIDDSIQEVDLQGSCEEMHLQLTQCFEKLMKKAKLYKHIYAYKCIISPTLPNGPAYMESVKVFKEEGYKLLTLF